MASVTSKSLPAFMNACWLPFMEFKSSRDLGRAEKLLAQVQSCEAQILFCAIWVSKHKACARQEQVMCHQREIKLYGSIFPSTLARSFIAAPVVEATAISVSNICDKYSGQFFKKLAFPIAVHAVASSAFPTRRLGSTKCKTAFSRCKEWNL